MTEMNRGKIGILVGGGPAPGINGVINSASVESIQRGLEVFGIYNGFQYLIERQVVGIPLTPERIAYIHNEGGSILRTSRAMKCHFVKCCLRCLIRVSAASIYSSSVGNSIKTFFTSFTDTGNCMGVFDNFRKFRYVFQPT